MVVNSCVHNVNAKLAPVDFVVGMSCCLSKLIHRTM